MNCHGCGKSFNKSKNHHHLCLRCFKIKNYGKADSFPKNFKPFNIKEYKKIENAIIVLVVSIFNISELGRVYKNISHLVNDNKIWLLVNKTDLLPKAINLKKIQTKIAKNIKTKYKFEKIIMYSALKLQQADSLLEKFYKVYKNIYLIGSVNAGKSSVVNSLLKAKNISKDKHITESYIPHTTIDKIAIPISKNYSLYDLPGFSSQITNVFSKQELKILKAKNEQNVYTFQLEPGQSLIFDSIARIDFLKGNKTNFTVFSLKKIRPHRTKLGNFPKPSFKIAKKQSKSQNFKFNKEENINIEIPTIAFISFKTTNQYIKTRSALTLSVRKSIL